MAIQLLEMSIRDNSTPYRSIFRSLGLATPAALHNLFRTVNGNVRRAFYADNPKHEDDLTAGFPVEAMYEGDGKPHQLQLGKLIVGDDTIAAYDTGYNVWVAVQDADDIVIVYNVGGLFLDLIDEMRLRFSAAVAPRGNTTVGNARVGCISSLASLLGLGYIVAPGIDGMVAVSNHQGTTVCLDVVKLSNLIQNLLTDREIATNPERVFGILRSMGSNNEVIA